VLRLQGYIFFGTSSTIVELCRRLLEQDRVRYLLLDFRLVQGIDVSSVAAFAKLALVCERRQASVLFSDVSPPVRQQFDRSGLLGLERMRLFDDLDRALEWVEDRLLLEGSPPPGAEAEKPPEVAPARVTASINELLDQHFTEDAIKKLRDYCEAIR